MNTISELEIILSRLEKCPLNLFRVELEMFLNILKSDVNLNSVISHIIISNENELGMKASTIVKDIQSSGCGLPPKNCTSYNVRKTKSVKRGELDGKERLHTGTDYK